VRTLTAKEENALFTRTYVTHLRVRVRRPDGTDVDLGSLLGQDWLMGVSWNESADMPVAQATVAARRNGPGGAVQSLSPQVEEGLANRTSTNAYAPLLKEGREFRVDVAALPPGQAPASGDWREVVYGRIDNVDAGPEELRFDGRDFFGGQAQDTFIEAEANYGNDTVGVAVQTVLQQIGTAAGLNGYLVSNLWTPVDPMWQLGRYTQKRVPVYEAWQQLAAQLGWEVRQVWSDGVGFVPSLRSPERLSFAGVWTFGPEDYLELPVVRRTLLDIRNVVEVVYSDYSDRDALNQPKRKTVTSTNPSSVAEYGRRYMQVTEASNSNINSTAEAQRLADAAIADLSDAPLEVEVVLRACFWPLQVGDMVTVLPDGVSLGTEETLAITSIDHSFTSEGHERTTLKLRGRPAISRPEWMARDASPGVAKLSALSGPDAPGNLTVTNTVNGAAISFTPAPSGPRWDLFELHVSPTSGFTPSNATLKACGSATRFDITDLPPGVTRYARVVPKTAEGSAGAASAQVALAPRALAPRDLLPYVSYGSLPLNADFEANSEAGRPPDAWSLGTGTWGTTVALTTDSYAGANALGFIASAGASISSQPFTVRGGEVWVVSAYAKQGTANLVSGRLVLEFLNASFLAVSNVTTNIGGSGTPANTYQRYTFAATVPAAARYAIITVSRLASYATTLTLDSVRALVAPAFEPWVAAALGTGFVNENIAVYGQAGYRRNDVGDVELRGNVATNATTAVNDTVLTLPLPPAGYTPLVAHKFYVGTSAGTVVALTVNATGAVRCGSALTPGVAFSLNGLRFTAL
jgi:hypothetical protein